MNRIEARKILRNPSLRVKDSGRLDLHSTPNHSNPIQSRPAFGEGLVKDFSESKALINRYISLFSINPSRLHAHPHARPAYVCASGWEGGVKDSREGRCRFAAVPDCGIGQGSPCRGRLGTPGPDSSREAIGNSRITNDSLFRWSQLQSPWSIPMLRNCNRVSQMNCTFKTPLTTNSLRNSKIGSPASWGSHFVTCRDALDQS
jgi:hypothetical protein